MWAPPGGSGLARRERSIEVAVDNIDEDLFGRGVAGGMFQPSDHTIFRMRSAVADLLRDCYVANLVPSCLSSWILCGLQWRAALCDHGPAAGPKCICEGGICILHDRRPPQ